MSTNTLQLQAQKELDESAKVFQWNRLLMSALGLWPPRRSDFLFGLNFVYLCYQMVLEYLDLFLFIDNLEHVLMNLTENMAFSPIFVRILMLRVHNDPLGEVIDHATKDFDAASYTDEERKLFLSYHYKSKIFMKLLMSNTIMTATSYYLKPLMGQLGALTKSGNVSLIYMLPYRFHTLYEVSDDSTYFWTYGSQFPFVLVSGFGQCATDCLMVTLVYHISGQMAVLSLRVANLDAKHAKCTAELRNLVRAHAKLLRMGKTIQEAFSGMLLGHLVGATALVCILGYQILACLASGETAFLMSFFIYIVFVLLILYALCTVGENLITESERLSAAFYSCNWYDMSKENKSVIILCTARSQKPLQLTAGKFSIFCLATLTSSLKTSMGYLSVLRTVMYTEKKNPSRQL